MATGTLQVRVTDGNIALPVGGATVRVIAPDGSTQTTTTDMDGIASTFTLPAPDLSLSLTPNPTSAPFTLYTVEVTRAGFSPTTVHNVQLFPDVESVLDVNLLTTVESTSQPTVITLPATEITNYPEKLIEPSLKDTSRVLTNVVIPEYIIVHDGAKDNTSAPNYRVLFKDYIKNVASSEIYPTWDPAALCANILAIISFTLNRVYTEWYPSNGYQFTITSDTD